LVGFRIRRRQTEVYGDISPIAVSKQYGKRRMLLITLRS